MARRAAVASLLLAFLLASGACGEKSEPVAATPAAKTAPPATDEPPRGETIAPEGAGFTVTFPRYVSPTHNVQRVPSLAGELQTQVWMAEVSEGAYIVNYTDMPGELLAGGNARKYLEGGRDGALRNLNATLSKEEPYEVQGYPALRFWFRGSFQGQSLWGRTDAIFAPPRLYQVQLIALSEGAVSADKARAFFDSFELVGRQAYGPQLYDSAEGGFTIAFPASYPKPETSQSELQTARGPMKMTMAMSTTKKGAVGVGFGVLPGEEAALTRKNFDDARDGLLRNSGAELVEEKDFSFRGHAGRRVLFEGEVEGQAFFGRADIVGVGMRLFLVQALAPSREQVEDEQIGAYFDSFALKDAPAPE